MYLTKFLAFLVKSIIFRFCLDTVLDSHLDQISRLLLSGDDLPGLGHHCAGHGRQLLEPLQHQLSRPLLAHLKQEYYL